MPSEGKIDLGDALEDTPQVQALVATLESCVTPLKDFASLLRDTIQACCLHQEKLCEGTDALATLLTSFQPELCGEVRFLSGGFIHIGKILKELHSCQEVLRSQLENAVIALLSSFLSNDLTKLEQMKEAYESSRQEHEQAMGKYSRVSKKKDSEKARFEANADLYAARRKFYQTSLEYYSELNGFQQKRKFAVLDPLLTFMHAQMAYFKVGHRILGESIEKMLSNLSSEVQECRCEYDREMQALLKQRQEMELQFPTLCLPDPDPLDPFADYQPPDMHLTDKAGYLFSKISKSGLPSKWDRAYYFTKNTSLCVHLPQRPPEVLLELRQAEASTAEVDDRRYALQISHPSIKRPMYLMAENEVSRDEWIATINNQTQEKLVQLESSKGKAESIRLERERIRSWVSKELQEPNKKEKSVGRQSWPQLQLPIAVPKVGSSRRASPQRRSPVARRKNQKVKSDEMPMAALVKPLEQGKKEWQRPPSANAINGDETGSFCKSFIVKYLGHMEIKDSKSMTVVGETILKVMAARGLKNLMPPPSIELSVTPEAIRLKDQGSKRQIGEASSVEPQICMGFNDEFVTSKRQIPCIPLICFRPEIRLSSILRCSTHEDNEKLFGIVSNTSADQDNPKLLCRVIEAEIPAGKICIAIRDAIDIARKHKQVQTPHLLPLPPAHATPITPIQTGPKLLTVTPRLRTSQSANAISSSTYGQTQEPVDIGNQASSLWSSIDSNINTLGSDSQSSNSSSSSDFMSNFKSANTNEYTSNKQESTPVSSTSGSLTQLQLDGTDSSNYVQSMPQITETLEDFGTATGYMPAEQLMGKFPLGSQDTAEQMPTMQQPSALVTSLSSGYVQAPGTITSSQPSGVSVPTQSDDLISFDTNK